MQELNRASTKKIFEVLKKHEIINKQKKCNKLRSNKNCQHILIEVENKFSPINHTNQTIRKQNISTI